MMVPLGCGLVLLRMLSQLPADVTSLLKGGTHDPGDAQANQERGFVE